jgi:hypothetical protein
VLLYLYLFYVYFISRFCLYMYVQFYVYSKYTVAENNYFLHLITLYRIHGKDDETLHFENLERDDILMDLITSIS